MEHKSSTKVHKLFLCVGLEHGRSTVYTVDEYCMESINQSKAIEFCMDEYDMEPQIVYEVVVPQVAATKVRPPVVKLEIVK